MRRFEYKKNGSNKFWEITLDKSSYTVSYGKIGVNRVTQVKNFNDSIEAEDAYAKIIHSKLNKGYREVVNARTPDPNKPKKFKMRQPPTSLEHLILSTEINLGSTSITVADGLRMLASQIQNKYAGRGYDYITADWLLVNLDQICMRSKTTGYYYNRSAHSIFSLSFKESDKDFKDRMSKFAQQIQDYNDWRKENIKEVEVFESEQKAKRQAKIEAKQAKLDVKIAALKQKMNKLQEAA